MQGGETGRPKTQPSWRPQEAAGEGKQPSVQKDLVLRFWIRRCLNDGFLVIPAIEINLRQWRGMGFSSHSRVLAEAVVARTATNGKLVNSGTFHLRFISHDILSSLKHLSILLHPNIAYQDRNFTVSIKKKSKRLKNRHEINQRRERSVFMQLTT